jgi:hypothetical protein
MYGLLKGIFFRGKYGWKLELPDNSFSKSLSYEFIEISAGFETLTAVDMKNYHSCLLHASFPFGSFFNPENASTMFHQNTG